MAASLSARVRRTCRLDQIGLIVVLFTGSWVFRKGVVEAQAQEAARASRTSAPSS